MKTSLFCTVLVCLGLASAGPRAAYGQEEGAGGTRRISLSEALQIFAERSPELEAARAQVAGAEGRLQQASAYPNPSATVTYEPLFGGEADGSVSETYVNLHQELRWPGERSARIQAARQRVDAFRARARADSLRGAHRVAELFVEAAAAGRRADALRQVTEVFRTAEERGRERLALGDFAGYNLRRVRIERARYESRLLRAELDAQQARRRLTLFLSPGSGQNGEVQPAVVLEPVIDLTGRPAELARADVLSAAAAGRAEIAAAEAEEEATRAALEAARLAWRPDPTVTAGYKRQSNGLQGAFLGLSVPLPIYHQNEGQVETRQAELQAAEARRRLAERRVRTEVENAFARYAAFRQQLGAVQDDLLAEQQDELLGEADNLLEAAQVSYQEGGMSLVELLDAARAYQEARLLTTDLQADLWTSYSQVLQAQGKRPLSGMGSSFQSTDAAP